MRVGRNDTCPCGSGKKYKSCCEKNASSSRGMNALFLAIAAIAAVGVIAAIRTKDEKRPAPMGAAASSNPMNPGAPQPGPAPAGKVWSTEHGHWHDANQPQGTPSAAMPGSLSPTSDNSAIKIEPLAAGTPVPPTTAPITITPHNAPAPPGPAPAGKVWSPEHGHWHDAVPAGTPGAAPVTPPPVVQTTTTPQPPGPVPAGKVWSPEHGHWHDVPKP